MKYSRTNYYKSEVRNSLMERDLVNSAFNEFKFRDDFTEYRIEYNDYMRPDLISLKFFGVTDYWWIILKCNPEIEDIWNDVAVDDEQEQNFPDAIKITEYINIPSKRDIDNFFSFARNYK
jgi:hypothetical protein